jgi:hypothetical protein
MGSAQLGGVSREPMSSSLCVRRESCALSQPHACYRQAVMAKCAPLPRLWGVKNAAVGLGLAAGRIDQVLQENKIDVTWEHPWNLGSCDEGKVRR